MTYTRKDEDITTANSENKVEVTEESNPELMEIGSSPAQQGAGNEDAPNYQSGEMEVDKELAGKTISADYALLS